MAKAKKSTGKSTSKSTGHQFGSDRVLLYDVEPWNRFGFGVPNFGDNIGTRNQPIWGLAAEIARAQLFIMTHGDAQRTQPPSRNILEPLGIILNRINTVLGNRAVSYSERRLEDGHATANVVIWRIHPVPYFQSPWLRNHWLSEYNSLCMVGLTNMYQHSDAGLPLTVTEKFAQDIWQYFREIKIRMATELLLLPKETVEADEFLFLPEHYAAYDPNAVTLNYERLDTAGPIFTTGTEDDLRPLFNGIPANVIAPMLKQYPVTSGYDLSGAPLPGGQGTPGVGDGSAVGPVGRTIGESQS